jgi:hypothetical protein
MNPERATDASGWALRVPPYYAVPENTSAQNMLVLVVVQKACRGPSPPVAPMGLYLEEVVDPFRDANQQSQFISLPSTQDVSEAV